MSNQEKTDRSEGTSDRRSKSTHQSAGGTDGGNFDLEEGEPIPARKPSQAEGDRETIEADLREKGQQT